MNGAQSLIRTLVDHGVDTCFMNPGTSEMHFVAALDDVPAMRGVLALFEGVATGAADGYARMAGRPAAALLHLGPGLGNGLANLHNARRAHSPVLAIVGDHAVTHRAYDAQLQSDIATVARNVSTFVRTSGSTADLGRDAVDALVAAHGPPGSVATLILPADVSWSEGGATAPVVDGVGTRSGRGAAPDADVVEAAAAALRSDERTRLVHRWTRLLGPPARSRRRSGRRRRSRAPVRDLPGPARPGCRTPAGRAARLPGGVRHDAPGRNPPSGPARRQIARLLLRLPGQAERPGAGRVHGAPRRRSRATTSPRRCRRAGRAGRGPGRRGADANRPGSPDCPRAH